MRLNRWLRVKTVFISWSILELAGFIWLGSWVGIIPVIVLIFATGCLGSYILRQKGFQALKQSMESMQRGEAAPLPAGDSLGFIAGFLLLIPGFFSDVLGLILLIPFVQTGFKRWLKRRGLLAEDEGRKQGHRAANQSRIIEGQFEHKGDDKDSSDKNK